MRLNSVSTSLQFCCFSGTGSIGGIHLPDFSDTYVYSKKKSGLSDDEYRNVLLNKHIRTLKMVNFKISRKVLIN